jgi:hypothetical protein
VASEIVCIENADLADAISPKELDRVDLKCAFALDVTEALDAEALGKRLESVPTDGDRAPSSPTGRLGSARGMKVGTTLDGVLGKETRSWTVSAVPSRYRRRSAMKCRRCRWDYSPAASRWGQELRRSLADPIAPRGIRWRSPTLRSGRRYP